MSKIIINERQYNSLILHRQETRLDEIRATITENDISGKEVIEEGYKEVILGVAMLLSQAMGGKAMAQTGHNKDVAEKSLKNQQIMGQIKSTLEDENKTHELMDAMEKQGIKNPDLLLAKNAEKIIDQFNKVADNNKIKYHLDTKAVHNLIALNKELEKGYALKTTQTTSQEKKQATTNLSVNDTLVIEMGSHNLFDTGGYELSQSGNDTIKTTLDAIKAQGGKILSVNIESSTDAEEMAKFMSNNDPTGNITLANKRTTSVSDLISSMVDATITNREIPNNGSNVVSTKDFLSVANDQKATAILREKTNKFRYVKISITAVFEGDIPETEPVDTFIKKYRFELVKVIVTTGKTHKIEITPRFPPKKFKCKKPKGDNSIVNCTMF